MRQEGTDTYSRDRERSARKGMVRPARLEPAILRACSSGAIALLAGVRETKCSLIVHWHIETLMPMNRMTGLTAGHCIGQLVRRSVSDRPVLMKSFASSTRRPFSHPVFASAR